LLGGQPHGHELEAQLGEGLILALAFVPWHLNLVHRQRRRCFSVALIEEAVEGLAARSDGEVSASSLWLQI
jgi:hypothetical protein